MYSTGYLNSNPYLSFLYVFQSAVGSGVGEIVFVTEGVVLILLSFPIHLLNGSLVWNNMYPDIGRPRKRKNRIPKTIITIFFFENGFLGKVGFCGAFSGGVCVV